MADCDAALAELSEQPQDLVVVELPSAADEAVRQVTALRHHDATVIGLLTEEVSALAARTLATQVLQAGAYDLLVLKKALRVDELLLALAKADPDKLTYGSNGNGTGQHLIGSQFESMGGVKILHVPYKGSGPLTTDLLGGQITMSFDTITPVLQQIKAGKLRALAVTTGKRSPALPDVPTLDEAGLKGFNLGTWFGVLAPAATPKDIVTRLNAEIVKIVNAPDFRKKMEEIGAEPIGDTPQQMAKQIKDDTERFAKLVKEANVTIE